MNATTELRNETPADPRPAPAGGRKPLIFGTVTLAVFAALGVAGTLPRLERRAELDRARARAEAGTRVSVVAPRPAPKDVALTLPGGTQAIQETTIYARTNGFLNQRLVDI